MIPDAGLDLRLSRFGVGDEIEPRDCGDKPQDSVVYINLPGKVVDRIGNVIAKNPLKPTLVDCVGFEPN